MISRSLASRSAIAAMTVGEPLPTAMDSTRRLSSASMRCLSSRSALSPNSKCFMPLAKFLLESANHVIDKLLAEHFVLQSSQKTVLHLLPLNPEIVLAQVDSL